MRKVAVFGLVLFALLAGSAEAKTVHLRATPEVQTWHSQRLFSPRETLEIGVYVSGFLLKEQPNGECELEWIGKGIAVRAYLCGEHRTPLTFQFVSFKGATPFQVQYQRTR